MVSTPPTLDLRQFETLASLQEEGQPDILGEIVGLFVREVSQWLVEAGNAVGAGDIVALKRIAHSLKGVCGTVGAERMRALAIDLEVVLAGGSCLGTAPIVQALDEELGHVMKMLTECVRDQRIEGSAPSDE